jgi:hypothetical protein
MKIKQTRAVCPCRKIPLGCLAPGVLFSPTTSPTAVFVKDAKGRVFSLPGFVEQFGHEQQATTFVVPYPEAVISVPTGEYDPMNPGNNYYKVGTESEHRCVTSPVL